MKKRLGLLCLAFVFIISSFCAVSAESKFATRGKVLEMILTAADTYYEGIEASDIMKGDGDGNLRENEPVLRVEAMAMLSRAFPNLPAPSEYQQTIGHFGNEFIDLPLWAVADLSNLTKAGIIAGYPDGRLGVNDNVTEEQMELLIRRIWAYLGNNLKDSFYATQNKQWLDTTTLSADDMSVGTFSEVTQVTLQRLEGIVMDMVGGRWAEDSKEQRIKNFYTAALDMTKRNRRGIEPIRGLLKRYDEAENLQELLQAHAVVNEAIGDTNILGMFSDVDIKNGTTYVPYISGMSGILEKAYFVSEDRIAKEAYLHLVSDTLQIGGESKQNADRHASMMYEMERQVALASLDMDEYDEFEKNYVHYRAEELYDLFDQASPKAFIEPWNKTDYFILTDEGRVLKTIEYFKEENVEVLKSYMKFWLLQNCSSLLSAELQLPYIKFTKVMYGVEIPLDPAGDALALVQTYLPEYMEEEYAKRYCSPKIKQNVTELVDDMKEILKTRLKKADWLSDQTRSLAIEKLENMRVNVAYPEEFYDMFEGVNFTDDLFSNAILVQSFYVYVSQEMIGESVDHSTWPMHCFETNAGYAPNHNSITIPAGILQTPFYDENASMEENFAGIGTFIAHEITHAFDSSGAEYDKNGVHQNWWTEQDWNRFEERCAAVEAFYDGWEISNYAKCDGELTARENIADLGGMACALDMMKRLDSPNYSLFFKHYAEIWKRYNRQSYANYLSENDVHAAENLRVNRVVVNFQEFYDAFDIQPGDGMYVPPEERIFVW